MRRILCAVSVVLALLVPADAAPRLKGPPRPPLYWATAVGTEWVYAYTAGIDTSRVRRTVVKAEARDGGVLVSIDRQWDGKTTADSRLLVSPEGLLAVPAAGKEDDPPLWLLKCPVVRGRSWELPQTGWNPPRVTYSVAGIEEVDVPAGRFEAVRVDIEWIEPGCDPSRSAYWYARDVGLVKWTNFRDFSEVLVSFTPGKSDGTVPSDR